jgi:hypothetical protein
MFGVPDLQSRVIIGLYKILILEFLGGDIEIDFGTLIPLIKYRKY